MTKLTKNRKIALSKTDANKQYKLSEAAALLKEITYTKFDASVDIDVRLGVDPRKATKWFAVWLLFLTVQVKKYVFWYFVHLTKKKLRNKQEPTM